MNVELSTRSAGTPDALHHRGELAPFCLLRIAAIPYGMLEAMRLPETEAAVLATFEAERKMEAVRQPLEDATYALVPTLPAGQTALRRALLKLRRDIHNGRPTRLGREQLDAIAALLPSEARQQLDHWRATQQRHSDIAARLEAGMRHELQALVRPALRAPLQRPTFRRALAFASAGLARGAAQEKRLPTVPRPDNLERSLLGYLNRAAAKTSPFSSFMALSVVPVDPGCGDGLPSAPEPRFVSQTRLNRGVFSRLYGLSVVEAAMHGDLQLELNPTFAESHGGRMRALCNRESVLLGRPWSEQRLAQFRLPPAMVEALLEAEGPATLPVWCSRIEAAGADARQAAEVAGKLLDRGVLVPPALIDAFDASPEQTLAGFWDGSASPMLRRLSTTVRRMAGVAAQLASSEGDQRARSFAELRECEAAALDALGTGHEPLQNMVTEDCWLSGVEGVVGAPLLQPLGDLQDFLSTQVIVSPYYERMRAHFLREFGTGGRCDDVVGFMVRVGDKLLDLPEMGARLAEPTSQQAPEGTSIPVTAQVQVAAGNGSAPPRIVVNRVFDGAGWLAARFTPGDEPQQAKLREQLRAWLRRVSHPREPVDLVLSGQCNDLQAHARLTERVLQWPGEPVLAPPGQVVSADSLRLTHDPRSNLLELSDGQGKPISLVYLGATLPSPIWGVRYALSILTQPYLLRRPDFGPPAARAVDGITYEPPLMRGDLVLRRGTWWVSREYLQREWFDCTGSERLLRVARDRRRHGIPDAVFAQRFLGTERRGLMPVDLLSGNRKPIWVDLRNPFWLVMLERVAEEADWVFLTEPLPGQDELWLEVEGRRHVCEMQLEMMVHSAPGLE